MSHKVNRASGADEADRECKAAIADLGKAVIRAMRAIEPGRDFQGTFGAVGSDGPGLQIGFCADAIHISGGGYRFMVFSVLSEEQEAEMVEHARAFRSFRDQQRARKERLRSE